MDPARSTSDRPPIPRRRKVLFAVIASVLFFAGLELLLALAGVQPTRATADPFVGFQGNVPLFLPEGDQRETNPAKLAFFNSQSFAARKPDDGFRIFSLGGSTTYGHPYDDRTSFSGWLRARLQDAEPDRAWEVVNCGGVSYASYRICVLMEELIGYEPDLFIVYTGHNEFLEERTYGEIREQSALSRTATDLASRSRVVSLLSSLIGRNDAQRRSRDVLPGEVETILEGRGDKDFYRRDPELKQRVLAHFAHSLRRMCELARGAGADIIFVLPPSNLRDFSPFKSEPSALDFAESFAWAEVFQNGRRQADAGHWQAALDSFRKAIELDPQHAEGLWQGARAALECGDVDTADRWFRRARDEDVCPLRAVSDVRQIVLEVAAECDATIVDFESHLEDRCEEQSGHRIPGDESFLDHVHPTIDGNRELAWLLYDELAARGIVPRQAASNDVVDRVSRRVLAGIDQRAHALALQTVSHTLLWAGKLDEALHIAERADTVHPGLSEITSLRGRILERLGRLEAALALYEQAVEQNPEDPMATMRLASALQQQGQYEAAEGHYLRAVELMPAAAPKSIRAQLLSGLGWTRLRLGKHREALRELEMALSLQPDSQRIQRLLEEARRGSEVEAP